MNVSPSGAGTVAADPAGGVQDDGTLVLLTATANMGFRFEQWDGDLAGSSNPATLIMDSDKTVLAIFASTSEPSPGCAASTSKGSSSGVRTGDLLALVFASAALLRSRRTRRL